MLKGAQENGRPGDEIDHVQRDRREEHTRVEMPIEENGTHALEDMARREEPDDGL